MRLLFIFILFKSALFAQLSVDSMLALLKTTPQDTVRLNLLINIVKWEGDENVWAKYNDDALALCLELEKSDNSKISTAAKKAKSKALNDNGIILISKNRFIEAHALFLEVLELKKLFKDQNGIITAYCNLGAVMDKMGKIDKALEYLFLSMKIKEFESDPERKSYIYGNISSLYASLHQDDKSLEYSKKAIEALDSFENNIAKSHAYSNLSAIYKNLRQYKLAINASFMGLHYAKKENDLNQEMMSYSRIASIYSDISQYDSSLYYSHLGLEKNKARGSFEYAIEPLFNIAYVYVQQKKYLEAEKNLLFVYHAKDSTNNLIGKLKAAKLLTVLYDSLNDYKNELRYYKISSVLKDSLSKDEFKTAAVKQDLKYNYDKKENELKITQLKNEEEIAKQKLIEKGLLIGTALLVILIFFIIKSLLVSKKSQKLLTAQKHEVETQKAFDNKKNKNY